MIYDQSKATSKIRAIVNKLKSDPMNIIKEAMYNFEWSQEEAAIRLKTSEETINKILDGSSSKLSINELNNIVAELHNMLNQFNK